MGIERMRSGAQFYTRVIGIRDVCGKRYLNAAELVNNLHKGVEVNLGVVRDVHSGEFGNLANHSRGTTNGVRGVDLAIGAVFKLYVKVAVYGYERSLNVGGVNAAKNDAVCSVEGLVLANILIALFALVGTKQQKIEGLVFGTLLEAGEQLFVFGVHGGVHVGDVHPHGHAYRAKNEGDGNHDAQGKLSAAALGALS